MFNYTFYNLSFMPLCIAYGLEVLPFTLRAKGMTISLFTANCAGTFSGFVNPIAMDSIGWQYYIVFLVLLCVWWTVIYLSFPETKGRSLEEVAEVFDGPAVQENMAAKLEKTLAADVVETERV